MPNDNIAQRTLSGAIEQLQSRARIGRYRDDPVLFAKDVLGITAWSVQQDIFQAVQDNSHVAVRSCHGSGKSFSASILAVWWLATRPVDQAIVVTTAPTYKQVHAVLWEDIRKHVHTATQRYKQGLSPIKLPGYITQTDEWKTDDGTLIGFGRKPAKGDRHAFQGIHRRYVLVIVDEACGIEPVLWEGIEAITTTENSRILAIGNPDDPATQFKKMFELPELWKCLDVSSFDSPNFTKNHKQCGAPSTPNTPNTWTCKHDDPECERRDYPGRYARDQTLPADILPMLPNEEWVDERRMAWGEESSLWQAKVLGQFPTTTQNTLFSTTVMNNARNTDIALDGTEQRILGVDLARFGPDYSTVYFNYGGKLRLLDSWGGKADEAQIDGMESAARVHKLAMDNNVDEVRVDSVGLGGPIMDRIVMLSGGSYKVYAMNGSRPSPDPYRWLNARAYWYDKAREKMFKGEVDIDEADTKLADELEAVVYHFKNRYKSIQIESKEDMKRRGLKSPDFADAAVYALAELHDADNPFAVPGQKLQMDARAFMGDMYQRDWISPL